MVAVLAHESCPFTGRSIRSARGHVAEQFVSETAGYSNPGATPEDVFENLERILDRDDAAQIPDPLERSGARGFRPKPYVG
jgi:hypothetical protein